MEFKEMMLESGEFGVVESVHYPVVTANGLPGARISEIVQFESGEIGEIFLIEREAVSILLFSKGAVTVGTKIIRLNKYFSVPVGQNLLGNIIDPLGNSISTQSKQINFESSKNIDVAPLGISDRHRITKPFLTGVTVVDIMVPLGMGQKELILGDRKSGKTSFLLSAMKNQIKAGTIAIYVAIAKRKSDIKKVNEFLQTEGLSESSLIIATTPYDSPSLTYTAPYSAMTIAEYFRDQGRDVLVVMDDLSTHARAYLEISLLAKRFPGRDSYPGDIFHTHARIMERAGNFKTANGGQASITVMPVAEVVEGDLTGYITTNLMSMTDGHIFFDSNIYYEGRRPAVNISLSVTRVGRQTQPPLLRNINRELGAFLTLYERVQNLSHFGAELNNTVRETIATGESVYRYFNQKFTVAIPVQVQVILLSLLWLNVIARDEEGLSVVKQKLVSSYEDESKKKLFDDGFALTTFNELLRFVSQNRETFLTYAK